MIDDPAKKALAIARDATGKNNLPMDQKSRLKRARAMGFDTKKVYYHGTDQDIKQFDPVSPQGHFGVYISKDPIIADVYATKNQYNEPPTYGGNIMPLYAKKNAPIQTNQMAGYYKVNHPSELRSIHANFDPNEINNLDIMKSNGGMIGDPEKAARQAMTVARGVAPDERQANFKRWFGNSKAVDPKGNPLVLYHGTQNNFNQFRPHGIGTTTFIGIPTKVERHGIFMSPHPEFASSFAQQGSNQTGANVMPLHVRMENPLKMDRNGLHPNDVQNLVSHGINEEWLNNSAGDPRSTWEAFEGQDAGWLTKTIQDAGYDGVHMEEEDPATGKIHPVYVAFHPTQIKSAIGNQGTYNLNDPDINKASGGMVENPEKAIRRATMVAKGLAKEIGPLPTGDYPKPPHPASMIPGVHVTGMGDENTAIPDKYADGGDVTSNPNFSQWFGNSVTHDNGVPRTYYTGTSKDKDFTSFNVGRHGAWFTTDPHEASQYAESNDSQGHVWENGRFQPTNTASRVIPAYLKAENPYTGERPEALSRAQNYKKAQSDWFDALRAAGHDSWMPSSLKGNLAVMLRHPTQIKSAIGNSGAFDPKQKAIHKADGGDVEPTDNHIVFDPSIIDIKHRYARGGDVKPAGATTMPDDTVNRALQLTKQHAPVPAAVSLARNLMPGRR